MDYLLYNLFPKWTVCYIMEQFVRVCLFTELCTDYVHESYKIILTLLEI